MDILAMEANLDEEEKLYDRKMPGEGPGFDEPTKVGGLFSSKAAAIPDKPKEEVKQDNVESLEDRKKRLQAQKQAMIQKRKEQMEQKLKESRKQETDNAYSNHVLKDFLELDKQVQSKQAVKKEVFMKEKSMKAKGDEDEVANPVQKIKPGQKKDMASLFGTSPDQKKKEEAMRKAEEDREQHSEPGKAKEAFSRIQTAEFDF